MYMYMLSACSCISKLTCCVNLVYAATYQLSIRVPRVEQRFTSLVYERHVSSASGRTRVICTMSFERAAQALSARAPFMEFHTFKLANTITRTRRSSISST